MIQHPYMLRILLNLFLCVSVLYFSWWFSLLFVLALVFLFEAWEVPLWGVVFDGLYSIAVPFFFNFVFIFTLGFTLIFLLALFVKRRIIFYDPTL